MSNLMLGKAWKGPTVGLCLILSSECVCLAADSKAVLQCAGTIIKQNSCSCISQAKQRPVNSRNAWHTSSPKLVDTSEAWLVSCSGLAVALRFCAEAAACWHRYTRLSASAVEKEIKHSIQVVQVTVKILHE